MTGTKKVHLMRELELSAHARVRVRQHARLVRKLLLLLRELRLEFVTSAYVSIPQHTPAYVSMPPHTSAYVSIRLPGLRVRDSAASRRECVRARRLAVAPAPA